MEPRDERRAAESQHDLLSVTTIPQAALPRHLGNVPMLPASVQD